jgi:predicted dehydrogenase
MSATETLRIGIIGAGANTREKHIPGLRAISGIEVVAVSNRSMESSERAATELKIPRAYSNWGELIDDAEIDAIVIGTWPNMHCPVTVAALEAGKHVMCEARMAMNAIEAHEMNDAAREHPDLVAQVVPAPMTLHVDKTARQLIAEGFVGDVLAVDVRMGGGFLDRAAKLHWRQNMELSGFNIMSMGIWYEIVMRWLGEATKVAAMGKTFFKARPDETGMLKPARVPEHVDIIADLAIGAQLHMQISAVTGHGQNELSVFGSEGTLRFMAGKLFGARRTDKSLSEIPIPSHEAGGWRVEEEFINAIRGIEPITHTTFAAGVKYMEFTEAVWRSMQTDSAIALPL